MFFQIERVEDVILDCDLDIVIDNDGDVDGVMSFTVKVQQMELMKKAVVTGVNGCHVVNGVGGG